MIVERDPLRGLLALRPHPALGGLHPAQRLALQKPGRFRAWLAGRRSGKSYAAACWLLGGRAGQISAYCARTLKSAKGIMLGIFAELNAKYGLGLTIRIATGTVVEPSGHVIQFYGLRDKGQADLMRGLKFRRVFVDEGGAFGDDLLKYAIEEVLQPTLLDYAGELTLAGTPGPIVKGYWYDVTGNPGGAPVIAGRWPVSRWTYLENPHLKGIDVVAEALAANGEGPEHATFKREYEAIWCEDADRRVYQYKGLLWAEPPVSGQTVMALDFGQVDQTTWIVCRQGYDTRPHVHVLHAVAVDNPTFPQIAQITRDLQQRFSVNKIVADEGALGKGYANHLRTQYYLPVEAASKLHKRARIDGCRGRLAAQTLHLCAGAALLHDEWRSLCWDDLALDHHPRHADDLSDALLYALEEYSAWEYPVDPPVVVTEQQTVRLRVERSLARRASGGI